MAPEDARFPKPRRTSSACAAIRCIEFSLGSATSRKYSLRGSFSHRPVCPIYSPLQEKGMEQIPSLQQGKNCFSCFLVQRCFVLCFIFSVIPASLFSCILLIHVSVSDQILCTDVTSTAIVTALLLSACLLQ